MQGTEEKPKFRIDFHSHVLPQMDDGSASVEESLEMLAASRAQGVEVMLATPHFYAVDESLELFLERRARAAELLREQYHSELHPRICLGAEVEFFSGIARSRLTEQLTVAGTRLILVEMPFMRWSEAQIAELAFLRENRGLIPVVAHIERYEKYQKRGTVESLIERGILFQSNAEYFLDAKTAKRAKRRLLRGEIAVIGSDSHNMSTRVPNLMQACEEIERSGGSEILEEMQRFGEALLQGATFLENL